MPEKQDSGLAPENFVEQKEKELKQKMLEYQFEYANRLMKKEIDFFDMGHVDIDGLEGIVRNWTRIPVDIRKAYFERTGASRDFHNLKDDAVYKGVLDRVIAEILKRYEETNSFKTLSSEAFDIIFNAVNSLPQVEKAQNGLETGEAGVLNYNIYKPDKEDVEKYGLDPSQDYIEIHFAALFKQQASSGKEHLTRENLPAEIEKSCRQLADAIKTNYPEVAGIICSSWLLDTDWFRDAVGFDKGRVVLSNNGFSMGNGFWGQFISATGDLKEERIRDLIDGQKPKHKAKFGFIPTEKFLKMHAARPK